MKKYSFIHRMAGLNTLRLPKTLLLLAFVLSLATVDLSAQFPWVHQQSPLSSDLNAVSFVDGNTGYIASREGEILHTTDGGLNWRMISDVGDIVPTSIDFIDAAHGWVAGNYKLGVDSAGVFETLDSGKTWIQQFHHTFYSFNEIQFLNDSTGWMAANEISDTDTTSSLMYTTTGGFSWTIAPGSRIHNELYGIHMRDEQNGISFGDHGIFFQTSNGGIHPDGSWRMNIAIPYYAMDLYGGASSGSLYGCAVGQDGFVLVTKDKWANFLDYSVASGDTLTAVTGYSGIPLFYAVGKEGCIATIRYALFMWMISEETRVTDKDLNDICQYNDTQIWTVGDSGTILYYNNNYAPNAVSDEASLLQDGSVDIYVLENDTDTEGHDLEILACSDGENGETVISSALDYITYFPDTDFYGRDTIEYTVTDLHGGFDKARVYIEVRKTSMGPFTQVEIPHDTIAFGNAIWGDIDGDTDYDIIVCGKKNDNTLLTTCYMNEDGTFVKSDDEFTGIQPGSDHGMAFVDLNADGYLDFAVTGETSPGTSAFLLYIYHPGTGYILYLHDVPGVSMGSLDWGDYDRDGDQDLLLSGITEEGKICRIFNNEGKKGGNPAWNFSPRNHNFHALDNSVAIFVDFNHDSYLDVFSTGTDIKSQVRTYYYTNLKGMYVAGELPGYKGGTVDICDYDADGTFEFLLTGMIANGIPLTTIYSYDQAFSEVDVSLADLKMGSAAWGDYDNDGDADLLLAGLNEELGKETFIYRNNGGVLEESGINLPGMASGSLEWGDYDADGDLDILMSGVFNNDPSRMTTIFRNDTSSRLAAPAAPLGISVDTTGGQLLLGWTPGEDPESLNHTLSYNLTLKRKKHENWTLRSTSNHPSVSEVPYAGNVTDTSLLLSGIETGGLFEGTLQAVDAGYRVSDILEFEFNMPTDYFTELPFSLQNTRIYAAAAYRSEQDLIPKLLYAGTDPLLTGSLKWNGTSFEGVGNDFDIEAHEGQVQLLDFDNDNQVDISVMDYNSKQIVVYLSGGDSIVIDTGVEKASYDWGDYDADGDPDLIISGVESYEPVTKIFRNDKDSMNLQSTTIPGISSGEIRWVDTDGDGDLDVAITGQNPALFEFTKLFENYYGAFLEVDTDLPVLISSSFDFSDYDGDGDMDMLLCGGLPSEDPVCLIFRNEDGSYEQTAHTLTGIMRGKCMWVDLHTDGWDEVVVSGITERVPDVWDYTAIIHLHDEGDYREVQRMHNVPGPFFLAGNFNGDYRPDLLFYGGKGDLSQIYIYRNDIISSNFYPVPPQDLSLLAKGDSVELRWTAGHDYLYPDGRITHNVRVGNNPGGSDVISPLVFEDGMRKVETAGNIPFGNSKLITGLSPDSAYYAAVQSVSASYLTSEFSKEMKFNPKTGTLFQAAVFRSNNDLKHLEWADIDNDRYPDILLNSSTTIGTYRNLEGSIDTSMEVLVHWGDTKEIILNDFDSDNDVDILQISESDPTYNHMLVNDAGTFSWNAFFPDLGEYSNSAMGDYNNDGSADLFCMGKTPGVPESDTWLYKNKESEFESVEILLEPTILGSVHFIDIDNDGDKDIIHNGKTYPSLNADRFIKLTVNRNMEGAFEANSQLLQGYSDCSVDFGDYDNDGDLDMLCAGYRGALGPARTDIFRNDDGIFELAESVVPVFEGSAKWFDYNNDGLLDIALCGIHDDLGNANSSDDIMFSGILLHTDRGFEKAVELPIFRNAKIRIADYDLDGRQDLLIFGENNSSDTIGYLYKNFASEPATPLVELVMNDPEVMLDEAILSWDWRWDPALHDPDMYYNLRVGSSSGANDIVSSLSHDDGTRLVQDIGNMQQATSFTLKDLESGTTYYTAVQAIDRAMAASAFSEEISFTTLGTQVTPLLPDAMEVRVYPLPAASGELKVDVTTPFAGELCLEIFDQLGRQVYHAMDTAEGDIVSFRVTLPQSGLYIARIRSGEIKVVRKIVVTKGTE